MTVGLAHRVAVNAVLACEILRGRQGITRGISASCQLASNFISNAFPGCGYFLRIHSMHLVAVAHVITPSWNMSRQVVRQFRDAIS